MDFIHALRVFVRVVDAGSFVRAAEQLDTSNAAVTRQVAALEKHLGARLLNRTTRKISLTSSGEAFVDKARRILEEIAEAESIAGERRTAPAGVLRVSAPLSFGVGHLSRLLPGFRARYPKVRLDIDLTDRVADLAAEGIDVALRIAREPRRNLVARPIACVRLVVCASPIYLKRRGTPAHPSELAQHETLSYSYLSAGDVWELQRPGEEPVKVQIRPSVHATNGDLLRELALAGGGIILQPSFIVGADLMRGTLVPLLTDWKALELTLYAVYLSQRQLSPRVRAFIDYLVESIGAEPYWENWKPMPARKSAKKTLPQSGKRKA
ncbi:MAG TPA: LysR substrate-binding domain-containing protein [Burkholderiales bacterium]|nr:LysR substrate-binding domain-containing protein [Burkholderiales bacterium]